MKTVSRAALSVLLLSSAIYGQGGEYELDNTQFLVEPGNLVLEHALWDYHHYYPKTCDLKFLDLSINPVYKHWKAIDGQSTINTAGAFIQGQLNFGDLWLRVNTIFGNVKQKHTDNASGDSKKDNSHERSNFGIDDVILKGGYDLYFNGDDHFGLYLLGGFPTKRNLKSEVYRKSDHFKKNEKIEGGEIIDSLHINDTPQLGTKHFRVGTGINGGFTLMDCDEHHLTLMLDTQYRYAFPADYGHSVSSEDQKEEKTSKGEVRFTPGHTVNAWTALHYAYGNCNFELGSAFTTTFGSKVTGIDEKKESKDEDAGKDKNKPKDESSHNLFKDLQTPDTVKFGATPYVAFSYNSTVFDNPATLGFGVGYDFNALHNEKKSPHKFQGVVAWVNASMSF